jgi:protein subunit release factor A
MSSLETKAESDAKNALLVAKLAQMESQVTQFASSFTDQDINRWNQSVGKTSALDAELNSVKLKLQEINPDHLKQEIKNLNMIMLTFCTKENHDRLQQEVNKTKTQIIDLDYSINTVAAKLSD